MDEVVAALGRGDCTIDEELGRTEHPYGHNAEIEYGDSDSSPAPSESSETEAEFTPREGAAVASSQADAAAADHDHDDGNDNEGQGEEEEEENIVVKQEDQEAGSGDAAHAGTAGSPGQSAIEYASDPEDYPPLTTYAWDLLDHFNLLHSPARFANNASHSRGAVAQSPAVGRAAENDSGRALGVEGYTPQLPLSHSGSTSGDSDLVYIGGKARPSPEV